MRRILTVGPSCVGVFMLIASGAALATEPPYTLRVMTYNIGSASPTIPLDAPQLAMIAEDMKNAQVDLVGMQEVDIGTARRDYRDIAAELSDALAAIDYAMDYYAVPTGVSATDPGSGDQVIWSRFPILEEDYAPTAEHRKLSRVKIQLAEHVYVNFFTTHYYIGTGELHQAQTDGVLAYANSFDGPRIITGDFNTAKGSTYYQQIVAAGFSNACMAVGGADCLTVGAGAGIVAPPRLTQIDFIFGSPQVTFTDAYVPVRTLSDHWPIVATVEIPALPAIQATPTTLEHTVRWGRSLPSDVIQFENCGYGRLDSHVAVQNGAMYGIVWGNASPPVAASQDGGGEVAINYNTSALPLGLYKATVRIGDDDASNSPITVPVRLTVEAAPGDFDLDNDVDVTDFALFQLCFSGAGKPPGSNCSTDADFDDDGDVDVADFARFSLCFNGINRLPACAN